MIQTINKSEFSVPLPGRVKLQYLVGSILCGVNEANMLTESSETVNALLSKVRRPSFFPTQCRLPIVLLLASPIQSQIITPALISDYMKPYAEDLIAQKRDIEHRREAKDPFVKLVNLESSSPSNASSATPPADSSSEWYVEEIDEGVDHYMFPRTMGYLVLEKQYEK